MSGAVLGQVAREAGALPASTASTSLRTPLPCPRTGGGDMAAGRAAAAHLRLLPPGGGGGGACRPDPSAGLRPLHRRDRARLPRGRGDAGAAPGARQTQDRRREGTASRSCRTAHTPTASACAARRCWSCGTGRLCGRSPCRPGIPDQRTRGGRTCRGLEPRHAHSRRHLEPFQDLSRSRIDPPQIALVTFPCAVPELAVDPGDAGDEALGLDGAKSRPCLGIDLMDLPVPILPQPQRPSAHASPEPPPGAGMMASTRPVFKSTFWMRSAAT